MKLKKLIVFAVTISMALTIILSGCGKKEEAQQNGSTVDQGSTAGKVGENILDTSKRVSLSILSIGATLPSPDNDVILKKLKEKLNCDLTYEVVTDASNYQNLINTKIMSGDIADIFAPPDINSLKKYYEQGAILTLDQYIQKLPGINKALTDTDWNKIKVNGKIAAFPKKPYANYYLLWVRMDWLQKLGLKVPTDLDEFFNVCKAFTENDPDGNGKADTYGYTSANGSATGTTAGLAFSPFFGAYGTMFDGIVIKDGKAVNSSTQPEYKSALEYIKKLIDAKVIDPEIMTNKNRADIDKAYKGKVGMIFTPWTEFVKGDFKNQMKAANPNAVWESIPNCLTGPGGNYTIYQDMGQLNGMYALNKNLEKDKDKLNRALTLFNYISDGEGLELVEYGIEGTHYKKENGKPVALPEMSKLTYTYMYQFTGRDELSYLTTKFSDCEKYIKEGVQQKQLPSYNNYIVGSADGVNYTDTQKFLVDQMTNFIYGKRSLGDYDNYVSEFLNKYNYKAQLDYAQKTLKDKGLIK